MVPGTMVTCRVPTDHFIPVQAGTWYQVLKDTRYQVETGIIFSTVFTGTRLFAARCTYGMYLLL